jgi:ATP-dependent protease Clp ATPase subunit
MSRSDTQRVDYLRVKANLEEQEEANWFANAHRSESADAEDEVKDERARSILLGPGRDFEGQVEGSFRSPGSSQSLSAFSDLQLFEKSNVLVLGPSGSGKTLLAKSAL